MNNKKFTVDGIWKNYEVLDFFSNFTKKIIVENNSQREIIVPAWNFILRNKKHPDLVVKSGSFYKDVYTYYFVENKVQRFILNIANYTYQIFDQNSRNWNMYACYNFPNLTINKLTEVYNKYLAEIKRKKHQSENHPSVQTALKDKMDEYMLNEITEGVLPVIEKIIGLDLIKKS